MSGANSHHNSTYGGEPMSLIEVMNHNRFLLKDGKEEGMKCCPCKGSNHKSHHAPLPHVVASHHNGNLHLPYAQSSSDFDGDFD